MRRVHDCPTASGLGAPVPGIERAREPAVGALVSPTMDHVPSLGSRFRARLTRQVVLTVPPRDVLARGLRRR